MRSIYICIIFSYHAKCVPLLHQVIARADCRNVMDKGGFYAYKSCKIELTFGLHIRSVKCMFLKRTDQLMVGIKCELEKFHFFLSVSRSFSCYVLHLNCLLCDVKVYSTQLYKAILFCSSI